MLHQAKRERHVPAEGIECGGCARPDPAAKDGDRADAGELYPRARPDDLGNCEVHAMQQAIRRFGRKSPYPLQNIVQMRLRNAR